MPALSFWAVPFALLTICPWLRVAQAQPEDYVDLGVRDQAEVLNLHFELPDARAVQWYRVVLPSLAPDVGFLDARSVYPNPCPSECDRVLCCPSILWFNATGVLLAADAGGGNELSEFVLSFGLADPRPPLCAFMPGMTPDEDRTLCDVLPYRGQHGPLSSGEYWIAIGNALGHQPGLPWHVASGVSPSNRTRFLDFFFRIQPPDVPYCDADFNWDGNTDQDDVLYLANVLAGGDNPTGRWADYNRDGNEDQDDLLALVHTIAGGGCP